MYIAIQQYVLHIEDINLEALYCMPFLKKNNKYSLAPIFDNGSSLFPQMIDENEMKLIISNEYEINKRVYTFPTSQIKLHNKKSSYFEVILSLEFLECNKALIKIYNRINLKNIFALINDINISDIQNFN